jgi:thiol-disulfide isomerase/thioredoxin
MALVSVFVSMSWAGPFSDLTFEAARAQAAGVGKIVLIDFYTTWCAPCKLLDENTWRDPAVVQLIESKAVALKIDAEKEVKLAAQYKIDVYPTVLLLKPDGTELDRLTGYREPKVFISDFKASLNGKDAVTRATEALEKAGTNDPMARMNLAEALADKQKYSEALQDYLWCFDHGSKVPAFAGVRLSFLLSHIVALGRKYPPALQALENRRDERERETLAGSGSKQTVRDLISLNNYLEEKDRMLALFDQLSVTNKFRNLLLEDVAGQLVGAKRYDDLLRDNDPGAIFASQVKQIEQTLSLIKESNPMKQKVADGFRKRTVGLGAQFFEALAGAQRTSEARSLGAQILRFDDTAATRARLNEAVERAGNKAFPKY